MNHTRTMTTREMACAALMAAVMCVLGPVSVPVPVGNVPLAMANFVICFIAWLLGARLGTASVAVYLLLGAVGLPVFAGYSGGIDKVVGPTGGYLIGYLAMVAIGGWAIEKSRGRVVPSTLGLIAGCAVCYAFGTAWYVAVMGCTLTAALAACVYPFVLFDLSKIVISVLLGRPLRRRLAAAGVLAQL